MLMKLKTSVNFTITLQMALSPISFHQNFEHTYRKHRKALKKTFVQKICLKMLMKVDHLVNFTIILTVALALFHFDKNDNTAKNIEKLCKTLMHNKNCLSEVDKIKALGNLKVFILSATLVPSKNYKYKQKEASKNYFVQRMCS